MDKPFVALRLGDFIDNTHVIEKEQSIEYRKKTARLFSEVRKQSKLPHCYYCDAEVTTFCNSHSIPAFMLKNIAIDGLIYNSNKLVKIPLVDEDKGINQSGTFQMICRDCDSKIFSDYEDPSNYVNPPTHKMLAQIALKNHLKSISKRRFEISLYEQIEQILAFEQATHIPFFTKSNFSTRKNVNDLDLNEFNEEFKKAKKAINQPWNKDYYMFFYHKLGYVVPIAAQTTVTLPFDLEGNIINDIYNYSNRYKIQSIHVCVFPLQFESVVLLFVDSKYTRLKSFYRQFNKLDLEDQLATINFMLFNFTEDFFISKNIAEEVLENTSLVATSQQTQEFFSLIEEVGLNDFGEDVVDFSKRKEIPNLLSLQHKVN